MVVMVVNFCGGTLIKRHFYLLLITLQEAQVAENKMLSLKSGGIRY